MKKKTIRKKLSGAGFRKLRREKDQKVGVVRELINMPYVGKLETLRDWHTQIARIYRRVLSGSLPDHIGTKLVYIVTGGANIAKALDEQKAIEDLRQQLADLQRGGKPILNGQEYLPARESQQEE